MFSLDYKSYGFQQKLPAGMYSHFLTYHNAQKIPQKFRMHSTTITSHGFKFLDHRANGYRHTDYRLEVVSDMFAESERNSGRTYYNLYYYFRY